MTQSVRFVRRNLAIFIVAVITVVMLIALIGARFYLPAEADTATEEGILISADAEVGDMLGAGSDVALSGNTIIIGAPGDDDVPGSSGSAYVFENGPSGWAQAQKLTASDATASDFFGSSVSADGDAVIIGARHDGDGSAYVFRWDGAQWLEEDKLIPTGSTDLFGGVVGISGSVAVAGAMRDDQQGSSAGAVFVYEENAGVWAQSQKLVPPTSGSSQFFGKAVAIDGDTIAVGSVNYTYLYENVAGTWELVNQFNGAVHGYHPGCCTHSFLNGLSLDGNQLAVGGTNGQVIIYTKGTSGWVTEDSVSGGGAAFGGSVVIDGDVLVVGAPGDSTVSESSGAAYVYTKTSAGWTFEQKLTTTAGRNFFGSSMGLSGGTLVVGAKAIDSGLSGKAHAFSVAVAPPQPPPTITDPSEPTIYSALPARAEGTCGGAITIDWFNELDISIGGLSSTCTSDTWSADNNLLEAGEYTLAVCNTGTVYCVEESVTVDLGGPPEVVDVKQFKSDGETPIGEGDTTDESTVVFKANVSSSDENQVRWQIELRELGEGFLDTYDIMDGGFLQTDPVTATMPTSVEIIRPALESGDYHWQYRAYVDAETTSAWTPYKTIDINADFTVDTGPQEIKVAVILAEPASGKAFDDISGYLANDLVDILDDTEDYWCEVSFGSRAAPDQPCEGGRIQLDFRVYLDNGSPYKLLTAGHNWTHYAENGYDGTMEFGFDAGAEAYVDIQADNYDADIALVVFPGQRVYLEPGALFGLNRMERLYGLAWRAPSGHEFAHYVAVSEKDRNYTWPHELGHRIGELAEGSSLTTLCDLYKSKGCVPFTGNIKEWGLMGGTDSQKSADEVPPQLSSISKLSLGWLQEMSVGPGLHAVESVTTLDYGENVLRIDSPNSDAYYILEARTKDSFYSRFDQNVPETGAVIYRVRPRVVDGFSTNIVNSIGELGLSGNRQHPLENMQFTAIGPRGLPDRFEMDVQVDNLISTPDFSGLRVDDYLLNMGRTWDNNDTDALQLTQLSAVMSDSAYFRPFNIGYLSLLFSGLLVAVIAITSIHRPRIRRRVLIGVLAVVGSATIALYVALPLIAGPPNPALFLFGGDNVPEGADPVTEGAIPDVDLHAYDDQGNHVGVNYDNGDYEEQIPGAIASGDLFADEEWIFVPEGTNVTYEVVATDTEQFLAENPGIAAGLSSTEEAYEVQAITYDSTSQRFESALVEDVVINPGETRIHTIGGTTEAPTVDEGVVVVELDVIGDSYLKKGHPNKNFGDEAITSIQGSGNNSPLVLFDQQAIEDAVGTGTLVSATLEMATIDGTAGSWTSNGKLVGTYRLTHPWTEFGATWNCHDDTDTGNGGSDCTPTTWEMNQSQGSSWEASPSDEVLFTNDTTGAISWDVTDDIAAWLAGSDNNGWIVRKDQDGSQGSIEFHSRETSTPPRLILEFVR